jgi:iron(III) transport system ATP-binding protein
MDEPLSNLDARLRDDMRLELKRLQRDLGQTAVYVTHDQAEALALSNVVAVMKDGRILQQGRPREVYERPRSRFVAEFLGNANLVEGVVERAGPQECTIATRHGPVLTGGTDRLAAGEPVALSIRPERVRLAPSTPDDVSAAPNRWRGTVRNRAFRGDSVEHVVELDGREIRARCDPSVSIPQGTGVTVTLDRDGCVVLPAPE